MSKELLVQEFQNAFHLYQDDKIFQSRDCLERLKSKYSNLDLCKSLLEKNKDFVRIVEREVLQVESIISDLEEDEGWTLAKEVNQVSVFYRHEQGSPIHSIKLKGVVDSPLLNILAFFNEAELYKTWIPLLKESRTVEQLSRYRKTVYVKSVGLPWPIAPRDVYLYGYGVDLLDTDNKVVIGLNSYDEGATEIPPPSLFQTEIEYQDDSNDVADRNKAMDGEGEDEVCPAAANCTISVPSLPPRYVRIDCKFGGICLKPISKDETEVIMGCNADIKLAYVPSFFINLLTKKLSHLMFSTLKSKTKNLEGTPYEACLQNDINGLYAGLRKRLEEHFASSAD